MSKQTVGTETIYVLNQNYQYVAPVADQEANSKWLDTANVMSVKRDKTIYAIRARNSFNFANDTYNSEWFANTVTDYQVSGDSGFLNSNLFRGFGTNIRGDVDNILISRPVNVYGNLSASSSATYNQLGLGGDLMEMNFDYGMNTQVVGNINVQSNVQVWRNLAQSQLNVYNPGSLPTALTYAGNVWSNVAPSTVNSGNVNSNTAYRNLWYNDSTVNAWNRLVNANFGAPGTAGNVLVTASTEPCDLYGNAIGWVNGSSVVAGNAFTNEAFRHQFQLQKNTSATRANLNPAYMLRLGRFGGNGMVDVAGSFASKTDVFGFSGNFFSNIGADNVLYAAGNTINTISITGNITNSALVVFNSNFKSGNLNGLISNLNGNVTNTASGDNNNSIYINITKNAAATSVDYISSAYGTGIVFDANGNLQENKNFVTGDRIGLVQGNLQLAQGVYMFNRISYSTADPNFVSAGSVFSGDQTITKTAALIAAQPNVVAQPNLYYANANLYNGASLEINSKYLVLQGNAIIANNWQSTSFERDVSGAVLPLPNIYNNPNTAIFATGNQICLYLRRGDMSMDNYTYVNSTAVTGTNYIKSVPSFVTSIAEPAGNVSLVDANIVAGLGAANIAAVANIQINIPITPSLIRTANVAPDFSYTFWGNVAEDQRLNLAANVVCANANSFIGNLWNYDILGQSESNSVLFYPRIVYGNLTNGGVVNFASSATSTGGQVRALTLNQTDLCSQNVNYRVDFPSYVGNTNAPSTLTATNYAFYPNLTPTGAVVNGNVQTLTGFDLGNLNNRTQLNDILLNGVAYSEFNFSNYSWKFTDLGNICALSPSTYQYNSVLPHYGNANLCANLNANIDSDAFINVIVDYSRFANLNGSDTDVHRLSIYDTQYRYFINDVLRTGAGPLNNQQKIDGNVNVIGNLFGQPGAINCPVQGNLEAPNFVLFTYEKVNENSSKDVFYPFYSVKDVSGRVAGNVYTDATNNYLFPGFIYKKSGADAEFFNYKDDATADFVITNNDVVEQTVNLTFAGVDTTNKTVKVALGASTATKTIDMRPIQYSRSNAAGNCGDVYSYIVCKISGEAQSYVVVLFKLNTGLPATANNLSSDVAPYLPVTVGIHAIEKDSAGQNQVMFKSALKVYNTAGALLNTYTNNVNGHKTALSLMSYSSEVGSPSTNVGVNIYSQPINTIIINFTYQQSLIKKILSYQRFDYKLPSAASGNLFASNGSLYDKVTATGMLFASSYTNYTMAPVADADARLPPIPGNASRYYLDQGYGNGVYVDISNNAVLSPSALGTMRLDRSVEWRIFRKGVNEASETLVGRGLMTRTGQPDSENTSVPVLDYYLTENNLSVAGSGFYMRVNTNIIDLSTRLLWQNAQVSTSGVRNGSANKNELNLLSKSDKLACAVLLVNPTNNLEMARTRFTPDFDLAALYSPAAGGSVINLSVLNNNVPLPAFVLGCIRGFGNDQSGSGSPFGNALFRVNIRPDCYALMHILGNNIDAINVTSPGQVLFSQSTGVSSVYGDFYLAFGKQSVSYQYVAPPYATPTLSNSLFTQVGCYSHLGFGTVKVYTKDFTSNYGNEIPCSQYNTNANGLTTFGSNPALAAFQVAAATPLDSMYESPILLDPTAAGGLGKYYIRVNGRADDRLYFVGVGAGSQPTALSGKNTLVLYSGLRPLVINSLTMTSSATLASVRNDSKIVSNNADIFNEINANPVFGAGSALAATISEQLYYVVLTNSNASGPINVRSYSYVPTARWFNDTLTNTSRIWLGTYMNANSLFGDLKLRVAYNGSLPTKVQALTSVFVAPLPDPLMSDEALYTVGTTNATCSTNNSATFRVDGPGNDGQYFYINVYGNLDNYTGFQANFRPATVRVYEALDTNNNGEIDTEQATNIRDIPNVSTQFGLNNSFSELLYDMTVVAGKTYRRPKVIQSWDLARGVFTNIAGSQMNITFNNLYSVGYNLDAFFVIQHNNVAQFDVLAITTEAKTDGNGQPMSALVVRDAAPLVIGTLNDWARTLRTSDGSGDLAVASGNYGAYSGLTFKVRQGATPVNIVAGQQVNLFVDNAIAQNTNEWLVSCSNAQSGNSYKVYSYDQERYAALLDEQIRLEDKFVA